MIGNTWYELSDDSFTAKMLPGDDTVMEYVRNIAPRFFNHEPIELFRLTKEDNKITEATKALDVSLGFQK